MALQISVEKVHAVLSPNIVREIRTLCWMEPFVNRGIFDPGWNCRDHAFIVAGLLIAHGIPADFALGKCIFVQGPSGDQPPIGLGNEPAQSTHHAWVFVSSLGIIDISPNLDSRQNMWRPIKFDGVFGSKWTPEGVGRVIIADSFQNYVSILNEATHHVGKVCGIYWCNETKVLTESLFRSPFKFINSPLTDRLRENFKESIYAKVIYHLLQRIKGESRSLETISKNKAWRIIDRYPENVLEEFDFRKM